MREARACILRLGGIPHMNTYAKLYLALLGQFPWQFLPTVPVEIVFFPNWCFFNIYEMSSWSRAMLMPLAILNHHKPTAHAAGGEATARALPGGQRAAVPRVSTRTGASGAGGIFSSAATGC